MSTGQDSLALRSELSFGLFSTCVEVSEQFGPTKPVAKCLGSELSLV